MSVDESDPLDRRVEPVAGIRIGRGGARILGDELAGVGGAVGELEGDQPDGDDAERADAGGRPGRRAVRPLPGDAVAGAATGNAGIAASAASAAAIGERGAEHRVTASVTVSIRASRARAIALSPSAPRSSNSAARSGT